MTWGVFVGRFQPLHDAHLAVMLEALSEMAGLLVVLGSARSARTARNPFTGDERRAVIAQALTDADVTPERVRFGAVRDLYDMAAWAQAVRDVVRVSIPAAEDVALIGFEKDASSAYLREFPDWPFQATRVRSSLNATGLRAAFFEGRLEDVAGQLPPAVTRFLHDFERDPAYEQLRAEHAFLRDRHAAWAALPEGPVQVAAHALITTAGRVLLVRRAELPGRGLWMLPGGPVHPQHALLDSLQLHLKSQVNWTPGDAASAERVFDHPARSLLGREIAHVYRFDAPNSPAAPSGTLVGEWLSVPEALERGERFYADHHRVLELLR